MKLTNFKTDRNFDKDVWVLIPTIALSFCKIDKGINVEAMAVILFFKFQIEFDISWKH